MPFDPSIETPIPLTRLTKVIAWLPKKLSTSTWFRYAQTGLRGHKLDVIRIPGSGLCSSEQAVRRFIERITPVQGGADAA